MLRLPGSPAATIVTALSLIPDAVLDVLGLTRKKLLDVANPGRPSKVGLVEAAKLDGALVAMGQSPLFERLSAEYREQSAALLGGAKPHQPADLRDRFARLVGAAGDLAEEISGAKCPDGPGGVALTPNEARAVLEQVQRVQAILNDLTRDVRAKCPAVAEARDR